MQCQIMSRFFKCQFESYLNISAKNDYMDKKNQGKEIKNGKMLVSL
jgi:hypothetical protein